ncbi:related to OXA1 - cytochrome oxidase biogenesis protein, mitochondrial [Melanopsichium pennsylvanicum]|uniref:Related to OXA1 - cytochrome oxidase biogenesis protein, mitochondrial n=2 Tax=Melanopsichium pennsylvanicum TaxID=63383 RepID=A0AAJ4XGN5_9BASI|nr:related to OXA1-cytochrome oxidase biogenesis protein, mitochondrial [Melanopsichium pennsylvanicum 4]SNX82130.1 related to OXA1 - cytochrome oxidase biogenesis protein, mitochondrial [Melanopsichium pennsylvanicum]
MVIGAASSLAHRATVRRSAHSLVSAARSATTSHASSALRFTPPSRNFTLVTTANQTNAYNSAIFARFTVPKSTLLSGRPLVASRNLSLWGLSSASSKNKSDPSTISPELETKNDQAFEPANHSIQSVEQNLQDAKQTLSDNFSNAASTASDAASTLHTNASQDTSNLTQTFSNVDSAAVSTVTEAFSGSAIGVQPGELTELGLNHWSTPPGWLTNLLEFVGTHTGLPWWGTIAFTTVALRLFIAPISISGQKNAIRLGNIQPEMKRNMDDIKHYKAAGDQMAMQKSVMATQKLLRDNKANPLRSFVPVLVQLPLMFSFFLALERIAKAGSYSFAHGGPFWTMDLTIPDPTYILPAVSTLATFAVAELGFKVGTTTQSDPAQSQMMKYIFRGFMPILLWISTTFPSGVLVYWATTNMYSLLQLMVMQTPIVRKWAKFPKRIQHATNPYEPQPKGFMEKLKAARDQLGDSSTKSKLTTKPVAVSNTNTKASNITTSVDSRSEALKEILDSDKAAYESSSKGDDSVPVGNDAAAHKNRQRVLKARQRRARQ